MNIFKTLIISLCMVVSFSAAAVETDYKPTTTWPYIYEKFQEGSVKDFRGDVMKHDQLNISVANGKAHFIENETLMELDTRSIVLVTIGEDDYVPVSGSLVKVIKKTGHSTIALQTTINIEAMNQSEVGYGGKSSLTNTQKVSANAVAGGTDSSEYRSLSEMRADEGKPLVLKKTRGLIYNMMFIPASKYDIFNISGLDKNAVKKFIKDNKIRLSDDDDLSRLADYISTL